MISYFFYIFNDTVEAISLPIQFLWSSLNCDIFNFEPYFLADFVIYIAVRFIIRGSLINLCVYKRFYDFLAYGIYFFNQALTSRIAFPGDNVFFDFI